LVIDKQKQGEYLIHLSSPSGQIATWAYTASEMRHYYSYRNNAIIPGDIDIVARIRTPLGYRGIVTSGPYEHSYAPAHLYKDGKHRLWFQDLIAEGIIEDVIYYTEKTTSLESLGAWNTPFKCFEPAMIPFQYLGEDNIHTGDFSVVFGDFYVYDQWLNDVYAASFTSGHDPSETYNCIGTAYSSTGYDNWSIINQPVIVEDKPHVPGSYGVGMGSVAWDPGGNHYVQVVFDQSHYDNSLEPKTMVDTDKIRVSQEMVNWYPLYPEEGIDVKIAEKGRNGWAQGFDIAYHKKEKRWYAVMKTFGGADTNFRWDAECRLVRAVETDSLVGQWELVAIIDYTVTENAGNHNPCLARYGDGSLYTENDKIFVFFGTGTGHDASDTIEIGMAEYKLDRSYRIDANNDDVINIEDLALMSDIWLQKCSVINCSEVDSNQDGSIDLGDFVYLAESYYKYVTH
jgi:hypothetical protein